MIVGALDDRWGNYVVEESSVRGEVVDRSKRRINSTCKRRFRVFSGQMLEF